MTTAGLARPQVVEVSPLALAPESPVRPPRAHRLRDYEWLGAMPFAALHLVPLLAFWTGARWQDWVLCAVLYVVRMFGVTAGYHRYFSHRSFRTSRVFQFLLAVLAMSSLQKGILWWAAHHRHHHRQSDRDSDPHDSRRGFWHSHVGWLFDRTSATELERVRDLARYPELLWLNRLWLLPPVALGLLVWLTFGTSGLLVGFFLSTVLLAHGTFSINSLAHLVGWQRYDSGDQSRNHWLLAALTLGEGWHNNHHYYASSARQGFFWWEVDVSYYVLRLLAAVGLVWDLRMPPARAYDPAHPRRPSPSPLPAAWASAAPTTSGRTGPARVVAAE